MTKTAKKVTQKFNVVPLLFVLGFAIVGAALLVLTNAAAPEFLLTTSRTEMEVGDQVSVQVRLAPGEDVIGVENVDFTFNTSDFQFVSVDTSGAFFDDLLDPSHSDGVVSFNQASLTNTVSTDFLIGTVILQAQQSSISSSFSVSGSAQNTSNEGINPADGTTSVVVGSETPSTATAVYSVESTNPTPTLDSEFGLQLFIDTDAAIQGGEVKVNLPSGLSFTGTLNTSGTAFNPATTVSGTTDQLVYVVFATQDDNLTGKQLIATIPVVGSSIGGKDITFSDPQLVDIDDADVTATAPTYTVSVSSPTEEPEITTDDGTPLGDTLDTRDSSLPFTIGNFDSDASYSVSLAGQSITVSGDSFVIPESFPNGDHLLVITVEQAGAVETTQHTIRIRNFNVDRTGCVGLRDLLAVNGGYGESAAALDLDYSGSVGLADLLLVTANWGTECL